MLVLGKFRVNAVDNKLSDEAAVSIRRLPHLTHLEIGSQIDNLGTNNIGDDGAYLLAELPLLSKLGIGRLGVAT